MSLAYIVPSRGRPDNIKELLRAWQETVEINTTTIYVVVDSDDPQRTDYFRICDAFSGEQVNYVEYNGNGADVSPPFARLGEILNVVSKHIIEADPDVEAIGFMGDDHRPRTVGWDVEIIKVLRFLGKGVVYGNDLVQGPNLPTAVAMTANIPKALGYLVPDGLSHMFLDNFWRDLGNAIGALSYLPEVIIEHCHPLAGKAEWDDGYRAVNNNMGPDAEKYEEFLRDTMPKEIERLQRMM